MAKKKASGYQRRSLARQIERAKTTSALSLFGLLRPRKVGRDDSETLIGQTVELYEGEIEFQSQLKPAVLVTPISSSTSDQKRSPKKSKLDFDDDLPEWSGGKK